MIHQSNVLLDHFKINDWVIDCKRLTATRAQKLVRLEPKAALILQYMAARPGEIITREELFSAFWPNQVVTEDALNRVISALRKALNDSSTEPQYIATIRKSGYRLVADVKLTSPPKKIPKARWVFSFIMMLSGVVFLATLKLNDSISAQSAIPELNGEFQRLTYSHQLKVMPHLSEDASQLAYIELEQSENTLVLMSVKSGDKLRFKKNNIAFLFPVPAPSLHTAFAISKLVGDPKSYTISLIDFDKRKVKPIFQLESESNGLSYHAQSNTMAFTQRTQHIVNHKVFLFNPLLASSTALSSPPKGYSDSHPVFSPAGKEVAFIRTKSPTEHAIFSVSLDGNETQRTPYQNRITGLDWYNHSDLIFTNEQGVYLLSGSGVHTQLFSPVSDQYVATPQVASKAGQLLLTFQHANSIGKAIDLTVGPTTYPLTLSNGSDSEFAISPDATRMLFASTRLGKKTLWLRHNNQLSSLGDARFDEIYDLVWSSNSQLLAAAVKKNNQYGTLIFNTTTNKWVVHWQQHFPLHVIGWDKNNRIWHSSLRNGTWELSHSLPARNTETWQPKISAYQARFTPDKKRLFYIDAVHQALWEWDFIGAPQKITLPYSMKLNRNWDIDSSGVYFISKEGGLNYFNTNDRAIEQLIDKQNSFTPIHRPQARLHGLIGTQHVVTYNDFWLSNLH
ncbi:winged helix-turn-helix domain-containing protein [Pseudoalteromonas luteoviolacea]|uniref:OmpR/PhoB-type domain-containing protein n=1 Tax=Pseudoalteromonas luteoviolacea S4060-1 TaxID=1365257 RepID=A0A167LVN4_9GAMM|nr:winged helix-turn-helix domain-containing protein [Pseudoalteromonas luteoviolacea]KZN65340.1 hypothetical protein N478_21460 [Pseudoalteromonas luteoviolacea S4060-1]